MKDKFIHLGTTTTSTLEIPAEKLGAPGSRSVIYVEPVLKDREPSEWQTDRSPRPFKVTALLSKRKAEESDLKGSFQPSDGGSYLAAPPGVTKFKFETAAGNFEAQVNAAGEVSLLTFEVEAVDRFEARNAFIEICNTVFDHIAFDRNIPLQISKLKLEDLKHTIQIIEYVAPYQVQFLTTSKAHLHDELAPIYSLYREAVNSNSDYYKLLCYYKILEGVFGDLRGKLRKRARKAGVDLVKREEVVPDRGDIAEWLREWIGKSINELFSRVLTRQFRDAVAHFMIRETEVLHLGKPQAAAGFTDAVRLAEECVRIVVRNHEAALDEIGRAEALKLSQNSPPS